MATPAITQAIAWLRTPDAIRQRCQAIYNAAKADQLSHFALDTACLDNAADAVLDTIHASYPDLAIPYHSRWRHFAPDGRDRWAALANDISRMPDVDKHELARIRVELVIISVLLDAGAGDRWRYRDPRGNAVFGRSEGLALASLELYRQGAFANDADASPYRADAGALSEFSEARLIQGFQVSADNPLIGVSGRTALLRRLGAALAAQPPVFGEPARLGNLYDYLAAQATAADQTLPAAAVLSTVLETLGPIWPGRTELGGVNLGDVWHHPAAASTRSTDPSSGLVPFHKLSQWLSYSLLEPLLDAGIQVVDLDTLTGLPEYRNGGLFIDTGVLRPRSPKLLERVHEVGSEPIVEWRALTVVLLDRLAERLRARLELSAAELPLAKVLEGGTWSAGRRLAGERRDGRPPLRLNSDGTVF